MQNLLKTKVSTHTLNRWIVIGALSAIIVASGCSKGGGTSISISGTASAPGGALAFNRPNVFKRMLAEIFGGRESYAAISGVSGVGAGVTINLIEVDASGNQVGDVIASTTTESDGSYTLSAPSADAKYIVRVVGTTNTLDARVTSTSVDVDSITDAVSDLVTTVASDLDTMSTTEVDQIQLAVDGIAQDIDPTGLDADALSAALNTEANANEEVINQINSTVEAGQICGTVTDASGDAVENIRIVVRDFGDWVTRAKTKTDSSGAYCANVADGDYIIGAINFTSTSMAASEWWSSGGTAYSQIDAEKVTVASSNTVTKDFALEAGARLEGTITAAVAVDSTAAGAALEGVKVQVRAYQNHFPLAGKKTASDGTYRVNIIPGTYMVEARNRSLLGYASEIYDGSSGTNKRYSAAEVTLNAGTTTTIDFDLVKGYKISGLILDNVGGDPVTGKRIRVQVTNSGGPAFRLRTNKNGTYRIWVPPDTYKLETYGQVSGTLDLSSSNVTQNFSDQVGTVTATFKNVTGDGLSQAKVWLTDTSGNSIGQEISSSDGTITLYSNTSGNHLLYVRIDEDHGTDATAGDRYGSTVYSGQTVLTSGTQFNVTVGSNTAMGTITLPDAGKLVVNVTSDGSTAVSNFKVQLRSGGSGSGNNFIAHRTLGTGSLILSVPAGTGYLYLRMSGDSPAVNCGTAYNITAGATTTIDYNTSTDTCTVTYS